MNPQNYAQRTAEISQFFEALTLEDMGRLGDIYASDARFTDPFNDVQGIDAVARIYRHMFASLASPRFIITNRIVEGAQCFLTWESHFCFKRFQPEVTQIVVGGSHLVFDAAGRIAVHRDYWDAAGEIYEKLPLVGTLMRWLKKRANT
jgi:limonene-1,2-epoxide hydrolase